MQYLCISLNLLIIKYKSFDKIHVIHPIGMAQLGLMLFFKAYQYFLFFLKNLNLITKIN